MFEEDDDDETFQEPEPKIDLANGNGITITIPHLPITESQIIEGIVRHFKDRLSPVIERKLEEIAEGAFAEAIAKSADELLREVVSIPQRKTNSWGEPIGEPLPLRDFITDRFERYMKERVDRQGSPSSYDSAKPRQQWLIDTLGNDLIVEAAKREVEKVRKSAESQISQAVASFIASKLAGPAVAPLLPDNL